MRLVEPKWLEKTIRQVPLHKASLLKPLRLAHLSDFHFSEYVTLEFIEYALQQALKLEPDLICITGDFISWDREDDPGYVTSLQKFTKHIPIFACLGNHDGGSWAGPRGGPSSSKPMKQLLEKAGVHVLYNETETLQIGDNTFELSGLGNDWAEEMLAPEAFKAALDPDRPRIVLSHNPDTKDIMQQEEWDIMLSGHTHGGQLRLPVIGTPFAPVRDHRFVKGLHHWKNRYLHVSKGVGNLHGLRFNCRPEISLLHIG